MVMNVKMDGRTWEQLLFILLQITQLTLNETPPRRRHIDNYKSRNTSYNITFKRIKITNSLIDDIY